MKTIEKLKLQKYNTHLVVILISSNISEVYKYSLFYSFIDCSFKMVTLALGFYCTGYVSFFRFSVYACIAYTMKTNMSKWEAADGNG